MSGSNAKAALGSALFFFAAPCLMGGLLPWIISRWQEDNPWLPARVVGAALFVVGVSAVVASFVRFVREGNGTPAPIAPTESLVVGGLYKHVRNPMYVAMLAVIFGQALFLGNMWLYDYALVFWLVTASYVRWREEPSLIERYGEQYETYRKHVPAWIPRVKPWNGTN